MAISVLQEVTGFLDTQNNQISVTNVTQATNAVVTVASNPFSNGQLVVFQNFTNMTQINGLIGTVSGVSGLNFTVNINSTAFTAFGTDATAIVNAAPLTQTVAITPTSGSSLHLLATVFGNVFGSSGTMSISDTQGNTWSATLDKLNAGFLNSAHFIANSVAGAATTITLTSSVNATVYIGIQVREIGQTSGSDTAHSSHLNNPTVITTDGTVGTAVTPTVSPGLVSAFAHWMSGGSNFSTQVPATGTGYTHGANFFNAPNAMASSESLVYSSATSQTATFTAPVASQETGVFTALFMQSGSGPNVAAVCWTS